MTTTRKPRSVRSFKGDRPAEMLRLFEQVKLAGPPVRESEEFAELRRLATEERSTEGTHVGTRLVGALIFKPFGVVSLRCDCMCEDCGCDCDGGSGEHSCSDCGCSCACYEPVR